MKYIKTYESFLTESSNEAKGKSKAPRDDERTVLLLDGTGSAGKSFTLKEIGAKKPMKGEEVGENDYHVIAVDDYWPQGGNEDMSDPDDLGNQARWRMEEKTGIPKEVREWAKKNGEFAAGAGTRKKAYEESNVKRNAVLKKLKALKNPTKEELKKVGGDYVGYDISMEDFDKMDAKEIHDSLIKSQEDKIKDNDAFIKDCPDYVHPEFDPDEPNPGRWYMVQEYKHSTAKNVVFDDVEPNIKKYLPKGAVKHIVLHSDPAKLASNIASREKTDPRDPSGVFTDYLNKYEFTKEKPNPEEGDPGKPTSRNQMKKTLEGLTVKAGLKLSTVDDDFINNWLDKSGMTGEGTYYMKIRDDYKKDSNIELINSDDKGEFLKKFKEIAKAEEKRVANGEKKVGKDLDKLEKEAKKEIKTLDDAGAKKMFQGLDPKLVEDIKKQKVDIAMPGGKKKSIQRETLLDFIPIDNTDPVEQAMIKAQAAEYARISALREKEGLKKLIPFEEWLKRNLELAKDNKDYQARVKAKTLRKMKKAKTGVKENVESFSSFLIESLNDKAFWALVEKHKLVL